MPETRLARFPLQWEAELARGYLTDAGIPCRLVDDGLGLGHTYVGGLAGASIFVAPEREAEARRVLEEAGVIPSATAAIEEAPAALPRDLSPALRADHDDLTRQLEAARKDEQRHMLRSVLGMSPGALIPFIGLAMEGEVALVALLCVLVVFVEGWRWIRAGQRARRIEVALRELEEEAREADGR